MATLDSFGLPSLVGGVQKLFEKSITTPPADGAQQQLSASQTAEWGIYASGTKQKVIEPDSIVSLDYQRGWTLPTAPLEDGAFWTYNKIAQPFEHRLRLSFGGNAEERADFQTTMESICASLDLYDIVTPDATYTSVNIMRLGLGRSSTKGVTMLVFDIGFQQVRLSATVTTTGTGFAPDPDKTPEATTPVSSGTLQTLPASPAVQAAVKAAIPQSIKTIGDVLLNAETVVP